MIDELAKVIETADSKDPLFPPTLIFREGWLLRLFMQMAKEHPGLNFSNKKSEIVLSHPKGTKFFSEARLPTAFSKKVNKDLYESDTHADGAIGDFSIRSDTKTGLALDKEPRRFIVLEAKIGSILSKGVEHAKFFDQAARTVACIANTLKEADRLPSTFEKLAFGLIAPEERIQDGVFKKLLSKESIRMNVDKRINQYNGEFDSWYQEWFIPTLDHINIVEISWEELIKSVSELDLMESIQSFYEKCLKYND